MANKRRFSCVTTLLVVALLPVLGACSPAGGGSPSQSPTPATPDASAPSEGWPETVPAETTVEASPEEVEPVPVDRLPNEAYPTQIGEFTVDFPFGGIVYDIEGGEEPDDRITVLPRANAEPAHSFGVGVDAGHEELRPGVWCYVGLRNDDTCSVNGTTGRLYTLIDQFDTLTLDELAAFAEEFGQLIE